MKVVDEARRLAPEIAASAAEADEIRRMPDATWAAIHGAGLFRTMQPARWGGSECHPREFADMAMELSRACGSAGWVAGVIGVHPWHLALYEEEAQQEMWGDDPSTMQSSSYAPIGKVTSAPGGYQLSGHWSFSSGADHCRHVVLGAMAGMRDLGGGFEVPDFRSFVLFPGQYTIVDAWHTVGGRGTGSQDIIVDDAFVPQHRTQSHVDYFIDAPLPGWEVNDGPLYRLPWSVVFNAELHHAGSGRSIYQNHELQRGFQDVQGFLGHTFLVADDIGRDFGAMRMGGGFVGAML